MYEEYTTQTTEKDRELMLLRLYDEIYEDVITYEDYVDYTVLY